jgi:hypothetical protein
MAVPTEIFTAAWGIIFDLRRGLLTALLVDSLSIFEAPDRVSVPGATVL